MSGHLGIERTYDVEWGFVLPDLAGLPGPPRGVEPAGPETHTLLARYFDTSDLRPAASGMTLRHREWPLCGPAAR
jgi:hypothetical protein